MRFKWIIVVVLILTIGLALSFILHNNVVNTSSIYISNIGVSDKKIDLSGSFSASAIFYRGYSVDYRDENLYISLKGNVFNTTNSSGEFNISIPNKYGKIKEIYLEGATPTEKVLIWPKK